MLEPRQHAPLDRSVALQRNNCLRVEGTTDPQWARDTFPWTADIHRVNQDYFGNGSFRLNQKQCINASMSKRDCFVMMPTGGGAQLGS